MNWQQQASLHSFPALSNYNPLYHTGAKQTSLLAFWPWWWISKQHDLAGCVTSDAHQSWWWWVSKQHHVKRWYQSTSTYISILCLSQLNILLQLYLQLQLQSNSRLFVALNSPLSTSTTFNTWSAVSKQHAHTHNDHRKQHRELPSLQAQLKKPQQLQLERKLAMVIMKYRPNDSCDSSNQQHSQTKRELQQISKQHNHVRCLPPTATLVRHLRI